MISSAFLTGRILVKKMLDVLFPRRCPVCDNILEPEDMKKGIHPKCEAKLYPVTGAVCLRCGRPLICQTGEYCHDCSRKSSQVGKIRSTESPRVTEMRSTESPRVTEIRSTESSRVTEIRSTESPRTTERRSTESSRVTEIRSTESPRVTEMRSTVSPSTTKTCVTAFPGATYNRVAADITQGKALYLYQGAIKSSMYRFKYSNKREYAEFFADRAVARYGEWIKERGIEVIVPVPMYGKKQRQRGYNQAEVFARAISERMQIPVSTSLVYRVKDTTPQKELDDRERKKNLKSAFQRGKTIVQYKQFLVVDDIYTTGSTAEAVAEQLKTSDDCRVYILNIAIGRGM